MPQLEPPKCDHKGGDRYWCATCRPSRQLYDGTTGIGCATVPTEGFRDPETGLPIIGRPTGPSMVRLDIPGGKPCEKCGGAAYAELKVSRGGWQAGSGYWHAADCATHFCPHGVRWATEECARCEAERMAECEGDDGG